MVHVLIDALPDEAWWGAEVRIGGTNMALASISKVAGAKNATELLPSVLSNVRNDTGVYPC